MRQQVFLAHGAAGPAATWMMRTPSVQSTISGRSRIVAPGEHIDLVAERRQMPGKLADVDILPAAVDAAQDAQRGGVLADEGDAVSSLATSVDAGMDRRGPAHDLRQAVCRCQARWHAAPGVRDPVTSAKAASQSRGEALGCRSAPRRSARAPSLSARASAGSPAAAACARSGGPRWCRRSRSRR